MKAQGILILTIGCCLIINASYIQIKASVAQMLIAGAFREQLYTGQPVKPWPWADTKVIAKLSTSISNNTHKSYVLQDASMRNLAFGPAYMVNTGELASTANFGNSVIVGHRDTHFAYLEHLTINDEITVSDYNGETRYKVIQVEVVDESDVSVLEQTEQKILTLITCYPFDDISPDPTERYVVRAIKIA
ncbi:class GN sortase [Glaciecola petra]|uniref:Class GN sortase n=1 Tax=Glaciecola petra TaxID=3075602 RepID=A0ABU2ZVB9_9ALTE|nr:class GN sortase [Aestuariibacter sp. P117]MDT0596597.1 class GN sortase [Aestuariibacter sp. P117]